MTKVHNIYLFDVDLEIELKTILRDTFCNTGEKLFAGEGPGEWDGKGTRVYNNPVVSHPCGNTLIEGLSFMAASRTFTLVWWTSHCQL